MSFVDDITQLWVRLSGRRIASGHCEWLDGPSAPESGVGLDFFQQYAAAHDLSIEPAPGLLPSIEPIDPDSRIEVSVRAFYERTRDFDIDAWSEWCGAYRPFGELLACMFTRRLGQLNLPLSAPDVSRGMKSEILAVGSPDEGLFRAWVRSLNATGQVIYCGAYSLCRVPGYDGNCVRVVFPLPNGSATVILYPEIHDDGSLTLHSRGKTFGDPGFYFVVRKNGKVWAKYVPAMHEYIHVYREGSDLRTDHVLFFFATQFLKIHYRLRERVAV